MTRINSSAKKKLNQPPLVVKLKAIPRVLKKHKLVTFLTLLLLLYPISMLQDAYKDWDNAQLIKGLAQDFPNLVADIEVATNLDLDIKVDCMTTTEKLGGGVRTCEMSVGSLMDEQSQSLARATIQKSVFMKKNEYENKKGHFFSYRSREVCGLGMNISGETSLIFHCLTAVREKNIELAKNLFTQVKNDQK